MSAAYLSLLSLSLLTDLCPLPLPHPPPNNDNRIGWSSLTRRRIEGGGVVVGHVARRSFAANSQLVLEPVNVVIVTVGIGADKTAGVRQDGIALVVLYQASVSGAQYSPQSVEVAGPAPKHGAEPPVA